MDQPNEKEPLTPQEQGNQIPTDYSSLSTVYTNFCRVNVTPEELVLDFGLNPQVSPTKTEPVEADAPRRHEFLHRQTSFAGGSTAWSSSMKTPTALRLDFQKRAAPRFPDPRRRPEAVWNTLSRPIWKHPLKVEWATTNKSLSGDELKSAPSARISVIL